MNLWRELTKEEELEFRKWARENYKLGEPVDALWHPVVRDEINKMAYEALGLKED